MEAKTLTGNPNLVNSGFDCPPDNPLDLLKRWLHTADLLKISEPRGLVLSTVNDEGTPSSRVVLLKTVNENGVTFASSGISQKGRDLQTNPIAAGTLWWRETMQQLNIQGRVRVLSDKKYKQYIIKQAHAIHLSHFYQKSYFDPSQCFNNKEIIKTF
jgi:pyridoxamine 5'-phosphate oxidase